MNDLVFIDARDAAEVCRRAPMGDAAAALLREGMSPGDYLELLASNGCHLDGIHFLAHAMVKRAVVWWAYRCAGGPPTAGTEAETATPEAAALKAVREWVVDPSDERRCACLPAAEAAGIGTPAGCTALAAFLSGGSLSLPDLPAVPPGEDLTARAAVGAILMAAVLRQPEKAAEKHASSFSIGREIAEGKETWPTPTRIPPPARPAIKKR